MAKHVVYACSNMINFIPMKSGKLVGINFINIAFNFGKESKRLAPCVEWNDFHNINIR